MQIDDTLDDRKAEAGRGFACSRLRREPLETAEQTRNVLRRQARPLVADLHEYTALLLRHQEVDGSADRAVFHGVAHEVVDRLADAVGIADGGVIVRPRDPNGLFLARYKLPAPFRPFFDQEGDIDGVAPAGG